MGYGMSIVGPDREPIGPQYPDPGNEAYRFLINIFGMGRLVYFMDERGMVIDAPEPPLGRSSTQEQWDEMLGRMVPDSPGIPVYKVYGSNDGWHVRPIECQGALARLVAWDKAHPDAPPVPMPWWSDWLAFIARAAEHNGFVTT